MDVMLSGGLAKGRWAVIGMVTEDGNSSSDITFLRKSQEPFHNILIFRDTEFGVFISCQL